jgi:riboflavin biosynthesis pyrimidine reductase
MEFLEDATATYAWPTNFWVRANLVASASGATLGHSGTSSDLTTGDDRRLLKLIRQDCDALIVGASSIRAEGWHLPPRGQTHILSRDSTLPWDTCPDPSRVTEWKSLPDEDLATLVRRVVTHLAATDARSILCEGGRATVLSLIHENLLDELCLTVRGASLSDAYRALEGIVRDASAWTPISTVMSDDATTIFSVWRCVTWVHS